MNLTPEILAEEEARLARLRAEYPDYRPAALMIAAPDQELARQFAAFINEELGREVFESGQMVALSAGGLSTAIAFLKETAAVGAWWQAARKFFQANRCSMEAGISEGRFVKLDAASVDDMERLLKLSEQYRLVPAENDSPELS